jgi:hypothetical protein
MPSGVGSQMYSGTTVRYTPRNAAEVDQYRRFIGGVSGQAANEGQQVGQQQPPPQPQPPVGGGGGAGGWNQLPGQRVDPRSFSEIPNIGGSEEARRRIEDAMMARARAQLDPVFEDQQRRLEQQLANRGLAPGSEAYETELNRFMDARNRAYEQAQQGAVLAGSQEAQRLFGQQLAYDQLASAERIAALQRDAASGNVQAQIQMRQMELEYGMSANELEAAFRQQAFDAMQRQQQFENQFRLMSYGDQAALTDRQQFFNELQFLLGGSGYPQIMGGGFGVPNVGQAFGNFIQGQGLQYQGGLANYQNQQQQTQNWLALAGLLLSSRDAKHDIGEPRSNLADAIEQIDVKRWRFNGDDTQFYGPIAEDTPAVFQGPDGKSVNLVNVIAGLVEHAQRQRPQRQRKP